MCNGLIEGRVLQKCGECDTYSSLPSDLAAMASQEPYGPLCYECFVKKAPKGPAGSQSSAAQVSVLGIKNCDLCNVQYFPHPSPSIWKDLTEAVDGKELCTECWASFSPLADPSMKELLQHLLPDNGDQ